MPAVPSTPRVKLRAASRRVPRARVASGEADPAADSEPNMRLSRAILVMLLLHVVAVGGILAFSLIKERSSAKQAENRSALRGGAMEAEDSQVSATRPLAHPKSSSASEKSPLHVVQPGETLLRIASDNGVTVEALIAANGAETAMSGLQPGQELKLPDKSPDPSSVPAGKASATSETGVGISSVNASTPTGMKTGHLPADSGKMYTVGKGESPYVIAQKLKVSYESLIKLNRIDDPKKLKPGQKLRIPLLGGAKSKEG